MLLRVGLVILLVVGALITAGAIPPLHTSTSADVTMKLPVHQRLAASGDRLETLEVYYSPLPSTQVIRHLGFSMAYHMAIVYTDGTGTSFGASSGPSNLATPQTPVKAAEAVVAAEINKPTSFGVLVADPKNDTPFVAGKQGDHYTQAPNGETYQHIQVLQGRDLSDKWTSVLQTYALVGSEKLPYSPTNQNSNSLAGTALRRIGIGKDALRGDVFAPGVAIDLPVDQKS